MTDPLPVNELWSTIQGEGSRTGTPSVFIRLQGCAVGCSFCDTKYTWETREQDEIGVGDMVTKARGEQSWALTSVDTIVSLVGQHRPRHVVITGGEPCAHDLNPLTTDLIEAGRTVQIETSGTYAIRCDARAWVTVSPKINQPGGLYVRPDALKRANEIKMPIGKQADIVTLIELLDSGNVDPEVGIWLQPLSLSQKATELCVQNAIANGWKVSLQVHALAGWR